VALTARALDWTFMPWQRLALDVANEIDTVTGEWAYPIVVLTVQRQAGKTVLVGSNSVHRCLSGVDRECWYTAQRRQAARKNFMKLVKRVRRSPVLGPPFAKIRESNGSETITFPTGSAYGLFAPTAEALHGDSNALVNVDEAWSFDEVKGDELEQAIMPTFTTVDGQLWIFSAAGNADSTWLNALMDTGRLAVEAGATSGMCYLEFGISDDTDPADLAAVEAQHPARGYTLRPAALAAAAAKMKPDEFARAYGNRRTGVAGGGAIPGPVWTLAADTLGPLPEPGGLALGFDVGRDGADAAIVAAWRDWAGVAHVEVADLREGTSWLVPRLVELAERHRPRAIRYDRMGPAVAAGDAAALAGLDVEAVSFEDLAAACPALLAGLAARTVRHRHHPGLDAAVAAAGRREVADRWVWGRRTATSSIAALVAATVAVWAYDHAPPHVPFRVR
jgi:hypothetical protein